MTNYSVKGGPAVPAKVVTSGASQGGPAIPVYQILAGDGYQVQGGPGVPMKLITDPSYPRVGGPALPIQYVAPSSNPQAQGGPAIPVYCLNYADLVALMGASLPLPYSLDFSTLPDGAMPSWFTPGGWTVNSGSGICAPTFGPELLTDPDLEAAYTSGLCNSLQKSGTPTVAESADAHHGSKAQSFVADANSEAVRFPNLTPTVDTWYLMTGWGKRTAGADNLVFMTLGQPLGKPSPNSAPRAWTTAAYVQRKIAKWTNSTSALTPYAALQGGVGYDAVILDDFSLKTIDPESMFSLVDGGQTNLVVKAKYTWDRDGVCGVVARANSASNPDTFLIAYYWNQSNSYAYCVLDKCVGGVYTNLLATWTNVTTKGSGQIPTSAHWLEIKCNGNTVKLFHNGLQVGTDQTVADVIGTHYGVFQSGGSQLKNFYLGADPLAPGLITLPIQMSGIPAVAIQFDDIDESIYAEAYSYMKTKKVRGSEFAITDNIDGAGSITAIQLAEMYVDGWDIGNHTKDHTPLATLTEAQQETELSAASTVLDGLGFTRSSHHVAYPGGSHNADTFTAMANTGMLTGRTVDTNLANIYPLAAPYDIPPSLTLGSGVTLAQAKTRLDNIVLGKITSIIYGHKLAATAVDGNTWAIADFQALIDYLVTLDIVVLTADEIYRLNTQTITHKHRID